MSICFTVAVCGEICWRDMKNLVQICIFGVEMGGGLGFGGTYSGDNTFYTTFPNIYRISFQKVMTVQWAQRLQVGEVFWDLS